MSGVVLEDQAARDRISSDLECNLLVEAGAGSGKTTTLISRMLAHIKRGTPVEQLAAISFTRKAASELREKFQERLENALRDPALESAETARYQRALADSDRAFIGTIHAFCARLLRERPLEAGLDPGFQEVSQENWDDLKRDFWHRWAEQAFLAEDPEVAAVRALGYELTALYEGFDKVTAYPDVDFPHPDRPAPETGQWRTRLDVLVADASALMPKLEPADGWDPLMLLVRRLHRRRAVGDWDDPTALCTLLAGITAKDCSITQKRWVGGTGRSPAAKALGERFEEFAQEFTKVWLEHCYAPLMTVLLRAATEFEAERIRTGQLGFEDLLVRCAHLLRHHPMVREELGLRYRYLLVDEFQDTDPVQAEVCLLLSSEAAKGPDWRTVTPREGALFVVGDPKQSIYRFRRADIQVYGFARQRFEEFGSVLGLTANFRSVRSLGELVNDHFADASAFPSASTPQQAAFAPMNTVTDGVPGDGVYRYTIRPSGKTKSAIFDLDAQLLATWIKAKIHVGEWTAGDFLILTAAKAPIKHYARALAERNVPVLTSGAAVTQEYELSELLVLLRALADPENQVAVVAALEGLCFGVSPRDLWLAKEGGIRFAISQSPPNGASVVEQCLQTLHRWWRVAQSRPADVLLETILDDTGILIYAASQPLGDARAGILIHLVEVLRGSCTPATPAMSEAIELIERRLDAESTDATLQPGRANAVRIMNLHKAKGLEANVVILAAPEDESDRVPTVSIRRDAAGAAIGYLQVGSTQGMKHTILAQPVDWDAIAAQEAVFGAAERERLRYVAATRARRALVVAQAERPVASGSRPDTSLWRPLAAALAKHSSALELTVTSPEGRELLAVPASDILRLSSVAADRVARACVVSFRVGSVTAAVKNADPLEAPKAKIAHGAGVRWGRAVHRCLEGAGRGRAGTGLLAFICAVARDEGLTDEETGNLTGVIERVIASAIWKSLHASTTSHCELTVMRSTNEGDREVIVEGVIDAVAQGPDGWTVVDWKTDAVDDAVWVSRSEAYERQAGAYAEILGALTDAPARSVVERMR